jgi:hypothetical protein
VTEGSIRHNESIELNWNGRSIRALLIRGVPWFSLEDILEACRRDKDDGDVVHTANFPPFAKMIACELEGANGTEEGADMVLLSPVGVFHWAWAVDAYRMTGVTAWARREARKLCPDASPLDPAMHLALMRDEDGWTFIPPGPPPNCSGWKLEWEDLKWGDYTAWCDAEMQNSAWNQKAREARKAAEGSNFKRQPLGLEPAARAA